MKAKWLRLDSLTEDTLESLPRAYLAHSLTYEFLRIFQSLQKRGQNDSEGVGLAQKIILHL